MEDWFRLTKFFPEYRRVSNSLLKDYGYMAILEFVYKNYINDGKRPVLLEFGHLFSTRILKALESKAEVWGLDDRLADFENAPYLKQVMSAEQWESAYQTQVVEQLSQVTLVRGLLGNGEPPRPPLPKQHFDILCSVSVIENIPEEKWVAVFSHAFSILKPGGVFVNTTDMPLTVVHKLRRLIEAQQIAGFVLEGDVGQILASVDLNKVIFENPTVSAIVYGRITSSGRYQGHESTILTVALKESA